MKRNIHILLIYFILILFTNQSFSQNKNFDQFSNSTIITKKDSLWDLKITELKMPALYSGEKALLLPYKLDNSELKYFRPVFSQAGYSCGQASSIGYGFTYEINFLRNLTSDTSINQYPSHFAWNLLNDGYGNQGVSFFDSWEILKTIGTPTIFDYGGMTTGSTTHWMTGYDKYYNGMHNRISDFYKIKTDTPEGLEILKNWMNDHLNGSDVGGLANIMIGSSGITVLQIPEGTPEAGKYIVTNWSEWVGHNLTIVGYNDSIRIDINNDNLFTNDLDINNDSIVDMKDWEIGAFKIVNSWGNNWADSGFIYMMYSLGAKMHTEGGIWNKSVYVIDTKENVDPLLTVKLEIEHNSRDKIKISVGVSQDTSSVAPSQIIDFPAFQYQGGDHYMQGNDTLEQEKTIEIGLDISPLLSNLSSGNIAKFFILVDEDDPENLGTGKINHFSIIDYTSGVNEITCPVNYLPLNENDLTYLSINHTVTFDKVIIENEEIEPLVLNEPYNFQLLASGGTPPYYWKNIMNYGEKNYEDEFPEISSNQLIPVNNDEAWVSQNLEFSFPFYGKNYSEVMVHTDGLLMLEDETYAWTYVIDDMVLFKNVPSISPFLYDLRFITYQGEGMWYEGNQEYALFRWKTSINNTSEDTDVNFAVKLFPDGNIEFYYGDLIFNDTVKAITGVSSGDGINYYTSQTEPYLNSVIQVLPYDFPAGLDISYYGLISGIPTEACPACEITIQVKDNNNLLSVKSFPVSTDGLLFTHSIISGDDNIIENGETAFISTTFNNLNDYEIEDVFIKISCQNQYILLTDSIENIGTIPSGETVTFENIFEFTIDEIIPDNNSILIEAVIQNSTDTLIKNLFFKAHAPDLKISSILFSDGNNNEPEAGETLDIIIPIRNFGTGASQDVEGTLISSDPAITINNSFNIYGNIKNGESVNKSFNITIDEYTPIGYKPDFEFYITASGGEITNTEYFTFQIGKIPVLILDLDPFMHSGPTMQKIVDTLDIIYEYSNVFPLMPENYHSIFLNLGVYFSNYELSVNQGEMLVEYLDNGGNLYMGGRPTWIEDIQTEIHGKFNINVIPHGWFLIDTLFGVSGTLSENMMFIDSSEQPVNKLYFEAVAPAEIIFYNNDTTKGYVSLFDEGNYKTIASSINFGELFGIAQSNQKELLKQYLKFFGVEQNTFGINDLSDKNQIQVRNYPNPFTHQSIIDFTLETKSKVIIEIFNIKGQKINNLINNNLNKGNHKIIWDARDNSGKAIPGGIYFYRIQTNEYCDGGKMILMKW
ncbi:MAG: T9SS type A sorting domain-containing protein [Bacteroidales bacterium]|nr:T9SS type A sorting domain-containing protein [Bacteroidales bacterium]